MGNKILALFAAAIIIAGCNDGGRNSYNNAPLAEESVMRDMEVVMESPSELSGSESFTNQKDAEAPDSDIPVTPQYDKKKIIKDGNMMIKVDDIEKTKREIDSLLTVYSAYYSTENLVNSDYSLNYSLTIRIPSANFEKFIAAVESGEGEVSNKFINARDVTTEYIDLESRLANKRSYLDRYRELLKQAKTVKDILEIESQIRTIVEEIDSAEGRLKYLSDQVGYSTLSLNIIKEKGYIYRPKVKSSFGERLKNSLSGGWNGLVSFCLFLIRLWPAWILLAVILPLWIRYRRRRKA